MLSLMIIIFSSTKFPPFFLRLHHISFKRNVQQLICRSQGAEISTLSQENKNCRYPRCLVGYCLSKVAKICTQIQEKTMPISGCRNWHVDLGNSPAAIIFYHDFCRKGFGVLDFEIQFFLLADLLAWETPYLSQPHIRRITIFAFIFYQSTQTKKNYLNYDRMVIVCSDWHFHEQG